MAERCKATTKAGHKCGNPPLKGEGFCLFHSKSENAQKWLKEGRSKPKGSMSRERLLRILTKQLDEAQNIPDTQTRIRIINALSDWELKFLFRTIQENYHSSRGVGNFSGGVPVNPGPTVVFF